MPAAMETQSKRRLGTIEATPGQLEAVTCTSVARKTPSSSVRCETPALLLGEAESPQSSVSSVQPLSVISCGEFPNLVTSERVAAQYREKRSVQSCGCGNRGRQPMVISGNR